MGIHEDHYAVCDECGVGTGTFGTKRGLSKRLEKDGWKTPGVKLGADTLCPRCNSNENIEFVPCYCPGCERSVGRRTVGVSCEICGEGLIPLEDTQP